MSYDFVLVWGERVTIVQHCPINHFEISSYGQSPSFFSERHGVGRLLPWAAASAVRGSRDYTKEIPDGRYRIILLGDSFTEGWVDDDDAIPAVLERLCPTIQAVNMGAGAAWVNRHLAQIILEQLRTMFDDVPRYEQAKPDELLF